MNRQVKTVDREYSVAIVLHRDKNIQILIELR
jgi:hypothetical protein